MQFLFPVLVVPVYFATPENEWVEVLHPHLPKWLVVWDKMAVMNFYEGDESVPWLVWLKPLCAWFAFALVLYFVTICLCVILRKQWVERERYTFPLVQVPLDVVERPNPPALLNSFFRSKLVLIGILLPFAVHLINGLHQYFPAVPELPLRVDLYKPFTEKPWYVMRWWPPLRLFLYFSVIGVSGLRSKLREAIPADPGSFLQLLVFLSALQSAIHYNRSFFPSHQSLGIRQSSGNGRLSGIAWRNALGE